MNETSAAENILEFPNPVAVPQQQQSSPTVPETVSDKKFLKSKYTNLYKHSKTGEYFVSAKVCGRKIRKRLRTASVEIAKARMDAILAEERERVAVVPDADMTFSHLVVEYLRRLEENPALKPSTRRYRSDTLVAIRRSWPKIDSLTPKEFTEQAMIDWAARLRKQYSRRDTMGQSRPSGQFSKSRLTAGSFARIRRATETGTRFAESRPRAFRWWRRRFQNQNSSWSF